MKKAITPKSSPKINNSVRGVGGRPNDRSNTSTIRVTKPKIK